MLGDKGVIRQAAEHIDRAAWDVVFLPGLREQWASVRIGQAASRLVFVERPLERPEQEIAFGSVGVNDPEPGIGLAVRCFEAVPDLCDIDDLAAQYEEVAGGDTGIPAERPRLATLGLEIAFGLLE